MSQERHVRQSCRKLPEVEDDFRSVGTCFLKSPRLIQKISPVRALYSALISPVPALYSGPQCLLSIPLVEGGAVAQELMDVGGEGVPRRLLRVHQRRVGRRGEGEADVDPVAPQGHDDGHLLV